MNHYPVNWGRPRDDVYGAYDPSHLQTTGPKSHTQQPTVTGTSVVGVKYRDGVVIAADNLASYGSLARFTDIRRLRPFNHRTILGFGGDVSDMQALDRMLTSLSIRENYLSQSNADDATQTEITAEGNRDSAHDLNARNLHMYLSKVLYNRRTKLDPLWNVILVAGLDADSEPYLASVDLLGTTFTAPTLATGFGAHLAQPILRRAVPDEEAVKNLDKETAVGLVKECMKVLFYRDARSMDRYSIATVEKAGEGKGKVELKTDEKLEGQSWKFAEGIRGYGTQTV